MPAAKKTKRPKATANVPEFSELRILKMPSDHIRRFKTAASYNGETMKAAAIRMIGEYIEETEALMLKGRKK